MTEPLNILFGSDFHFGSPNTDQQELADAFAAVIFPLLAETDIFFINGDFFDTLVSFDNHGFDPIADTIINLFHICEQHQVTLRLLQGTWMHDRNQCHRFENLYRNGRFTFNFRFAKAIELEIITLRDTSIRVLYVPDDLPFKTSDDIVEVIRGKMDELGWDYVDYACMHGFFEFTFPKNVSQTNVVVFREDQFPFVKKMIDVGHVHQNRIQGKVISNGSFDRHCFGDEDPKGCIRVLDYSDRYTAQFVENTQAAVYDTVYVTKDDTTETISKRVVVHLKKLKTDRKIYLRFAVESIEHVSVIKQWMKDTYPDVAIKIKMISDVEDKPMINPSSVLLTPVEKRIAPTPKTIATFIRSHIPEDYTLTTEQIEEYLLPA